jgi:hypothetical protein
MARRRLSFDDRDARFVAAMAHHGVSKIEIARAIGIDVKTLDKHFSEVLATAAARRRADEIIALVARAKAGSARALLKIEAATRRGSASIA